MKKLFFLISVLLSLTFSVFAIPYFSSTIADDPGEFVYYKDSSFKRESYIGILCYDDVTLQVKYYAPADKKNNLAEKEIAILITLNPQTSYMEFTGEKIISQLQPDSEDVDIVNYLHDILYEFNSHRLLAGEIKDSADIYNSNIFIQDYPQFGGQASVSYNPIIPLFNISQIKAPDGSIALKCITIGRITSAEDKLFDNFKGLPEVKESKNKKKYKAKKEKKYTYENQSITLGSEWDRVSSGANGEVFDNVFILGEDAFLSLTNIPGEYIENDFYFARKLLESSEDSISDLQNSYVKYDEKKHCLELYVEIINQKNNSKLVKNIKLARLLGVDNPLEKKYNYLSLAVFKQAYDSNAAYFKKIFNSWTY